MLIHLSLSPSPSIASLSDMVIFCLASSQLIYPSICVMHIKILQMIFFFSVLTECASKAHGSKRNVCKPTPARRGLMFQLRRNFKWTFPASELPWKVNKQIKTTTQTKVGEKSCSFEYNDLLQVGDPQRLHFKLHH